MSNNYTPQDAMLDMVVEIRTLRDRYTAAAACSRQTANAKLISDLNRIIYDGLAFIRGEQSIAEGNYTIDAAVMVSKEVVLEVLGWNPTAKLSND